MGAFWSQPEPIICVYGTFVVRSSKLIRKDENVDTFAELGELRTSEAIGRMAVRYRRFCFVDDDVFERLIDVAIEKSSEGDWIVVPDNTLIVCPADRRFTNADWVAPEFDVLFLGGTKEGLEFLKKDLTLFK